MSLVCFEEDPEIPGKPIRFVGCNMTYVEEEHDTPLEVSNAFYLKHVGYEHEVSKFRDSRIN